LVIYFLGGGENGGVGNNWRRMELGYLHSNFFDYLEDILDEHGFGEIELGDDGYFIFRK
jgi:hypothetical protein